jgi:short-subunit dehydrogenase
LKASHGRIVAVSSLAGLVGVPGRTAYCASKFAMTGFFEALRSELKDSGVSVTVAYPGVVSTDIRTHGWNEHGEIAGVSGLHEDNAMSTQECARLIIYTMVRRRREVVMTAKGKMGRWLKLWVPSLVDRMAMAAVKADFRPHP